jgi:uncharacterized membrane protein
MQERIEEDVRNEDESPSEAPSFSVTLLPHRSLSRKGFVALMCVFGAASFITGAAFVVMGAWPVTGFFCLDAALLYLAFRLNYRAALLSENVDLADRELKVTRRHPSGRSETWSFNPYWVRFQYTRRDHAADELSLSSHGRTLIFGAFLSDLEKANFAEKLSDALDRQKT